MNIARGWIRRVLAYLKEVSLGTDFPVWATLLGVLLGGAATAVGTYLIVPKINYELERQKIRSEFVIRNLDDLNNRTRSLLSGVTCTRQYCDRTRRTPKPSNG